MPAAESWIAALLRERGGDAMALNDAHLNPQLGRIVRPLQGILRAGPFHRRPRSFRDLLY